MHERKESSEFYVPYLPVPVGHRRWLRVLVPCVMWVLAIVAGLFAYSQSNPGAAVWEDGKARAFKGTIVAHPYPALFTADRGDGRPGVVLLVEVGKRGGGQRAARFDGQAVTVSGWALHRDGRLLLEMEPGEAAIVADGGTSPAALPEAEPLGRVTLRGEIVDSKCFLGAMKPGEGKTHKECATLCISGGIPPMLVTRTSTGAMTFYLLVNPEGGPLDPACYPLIGEPVEALGSLERRADLYILRVDVSHLRRL